MVNKICGYCGAESALKVVCQDCGCLCCLGCSCDGFCLDCYIYKNRRVFVVEYNADKYDGSTLG